MVSRPDPTALPPRRCRNVGFLPGAWGTWCPPCSGCLGSQKPRPAASHAREEALCSKARARRPRPWRLGPASPLHSDVGCPQNPCPTHPCGQGPADAQRGGETEAVGWRGLTRQGVKLVLVPGGKDWPRGGMREPGSRRAARRAERAWEEGW